MTIEESIKKAMHDLGVPSDSDLPWDDSYTPSEKPVKPPRSASKTKGRAKPVKEKKASNKPVGAVIEDEAPHVLFKMRGDHIVLIISGDFPIEEKSVSGETFKVITMSTPDFTSEQLQVLNVYQEPIIDQDNSEQELIKLRVQAGAIAEELKEARVNGTMKTYEMLKREHVKALQRIKELGG